MVLCDKLCSVTGFELGKKHLIVSPLTCKLNQLEDLCRGSDFEVSVFPSLNVIKRYLVNNQDLNLNLPSGEIYILHLPLGEVKKEELKEIVSYMDDALLVTVKGDISLKPKPIENYSFLTRSNTKY